MNPRAIAPKGLQPKNLKEVVLRKEQGVLDALRISGNLSVEEIAELVRISSSSAYRMVNRLHSRKEIHVAEWKRPEGAGTMTRLFGFGEGKDAIKPEPVSLEERRRSYQKRNKVAISIRRYGARSRHAGLWAGLIIQTA